MSPFLCQTRPSSNHSTSILEPKTIGYCSIFVLSKFLPCLSNHLVLIVALSHITKASSASVKLVNLVCISFKAFSTSCSVTFVFFFFREIFL